MRLSFLGAAGEVTGSCTLVETGETRFLVDCGMFQGGPEARTKNLRALDFGFDVREIDFVLLTHAHIDHSGAIPRLVDQGFRGVIHASAKPNKGAASTRITSRRPVANRWKSSRRPSTKPSASLAACESGKIAIAFSYWRRASSSWPRACWASPMHRCAKYLMPGSVAFAMALGRCGRASSFSSRPVHPRVDVTAEPEELIERAA